MGDYLSMKKMRPKKRKSNESYNEQGDVTFPLTLVPSSSSTFISSSSSTIKKICFWGKVTWFVVNIDFKRKQLTNDMKERASFVHNDFHSQITNRGVEKETTLTPVFSLPMNDSPIPLRLNTFATLDSFVFSIGGIRKDTKYSSKRKDSEYTGSNLVFYFDTRYKYDNYCWKQAPSMTTHRQKAQVITLDHKLYVFGCFGERKCPHNPSCLWAEVFDPSIEKWSSLSVPEFEHTLLICTPNHPESAKKISAILDETSVYELNIETQIWNFVANVEVALTTGIRQPVLVGNIYFWFDVNLMGYDILKKKNFEGPVQDISFERSMRYLQPEESNTINYSEYGPTTTVHLGGRYFCYLGYLHDLEEEDPKRIHCSIVKVSKTKQRYQPFDLAGNISSLFLRARVLSCQSFPIEHELQFLDGRIMVI